MFSGNRLFSAAVGGFLAVFLLAAPALCQEKTDESAAQQSHEKAAAQNTKNGKTPHHIPNAVDNGGAQSQEAKSLPAQIPQDFGWRWLASIWKWVLDNVDGKDGWAQWVMVFTGVIAILINVVTLGLLYCTLRHTRDTAKAAIAAALASQRTFYAQHRPKLVVRQPIAPINDPEEHTIVVVYTIANTGDTECWITEAHIGIDFITSDGYPAMSLPPQNAYPNIVPHIGRIAPGEAISCRHVDTQHRWDSDHRREWPDRMGVFFCGFVSYLDSPESNIRRQMSFRRKYDIHTQRFRRIKDVDPDDDFED